MQWFLVQNGNYLHWHTKQKTDRYCIKYQRIFFVLLVYQTYQILNYPKEMHWSLNTNASHPHHIFQWFQKGSPHYLNAYSSYCHSYLRLSHYSSQPCKQHYQTAVHPKYVKYKTIHVFGLRPRK